MHTDIRGTRHDLIMALQHRFPILLHVDFIQLAESVIELDIGV